MPWSHVLKMVNSNLKTSKTLEQAREDFQKQGLLNNLSDSLKDLETITLEQ